MKPNCGNEYIQKITIKLNVGFDRHIHYLSELKDILVSKLNYRLYRQLHNKIYTDNNDRHV
jgi:hypothetical protein